VTTDANGSEWYADGLRFECSQCGNCCTGPPGAVWFTEDEGRAMAARLGIPEERFYRTFARREGGRWSLTERKTVHGFDCTFLDRETAPGKAICRLYDARPVQCRTWPFWPENLETPEAWEEARRVTPCPGMGHGKLVPIESIRIQRDEARAADA
jgi:Fe-S-cluster containining protein